MKIVELSVKELDTLETALVYRIIENNGLVQELREEREELLKMSDLTTGVEEAAYELLLDRNANWTKQVKQESSELHALRNKLRETK